MMLNLTPFGRWTLRDKAAQRRLALRWSIKEEFMDIISTISTSLSLTKRLREISKNIEDAEFKNLLADLSSELADLKLEAASLKERFSQLQEENDLLKKTSQPVDEKPIGRKWGCYIFEHDSGLYCPACWDSKRRKSSTTRVNTRFRHCPVCNAPIGAG